jgi:hypothetical protein
MAVPVSLENAAEIAVAARKAKLSSLSQEIQTRHYCNEHKVADYVCKDGQHMPYTHAQIAQWAELLVCTQVSQRGGYKPDCEYQANNHKDVTMAKPPEELRLFDHVPKRPQAKSTATAPVAHDPVPNDMPAVTEPPPPPPQPQPGPQYAATAPPMTNTIFPNAAAPAMIPNAAVAQNAAIMGSYGQPMPFPTNFPYFTPGLSGTAFMQNPFASPYLSYPAVPPGFQLVPIDNSSQIATDDPRKRRREEDNHMANFHNATALVLYPEMKGWLEYCDRNLVRGRDAENYTQFADALVSKRLLRLDDLDGLQIGELQALCPGMELGTARRLLRFAHEDVETLRNGQRLPIL